ncbi:TPA: restriction endonuclease subunit S [Vibrio vulnificus]|nr:restriction endonuclease subunit S [Vibrio vulnificus]HAS6291744.1 restriction endonuclease subunit S [Vibrio vulnificus]HAS6314854.1 restriction endonuclease subunit S [Vibrio vulnificus]HDY7555321.1 restriction endonuclease subunit S [Vibrio vulnificus]HDY7573314.1 restriction endonuclease subunit S [Vibrio vulnificus]
MDKTVGLACNISTGKLDANQAVSGGKYPFFTCAEFPDNIDHFAYDDDVVLVAGNNARGNFHVSRYKGKFNAYQRTYILTAKEGFNIDYIYYALKLELKRLRERAQGSQTKFLTMPILTGIHLRDVTGDEQTEIANVLSALDKKIELNNRINIELEAMAKTLYEYWFVQFDFPDANGKPYKASGGKMVYNDTLKREIPEGWSASNILSVANLLGGGTPSKSKAEYWNGHIPFFTPSDSDKNVFSIETESYITDLGLEKSSTRLFEKNTVFITARGSVGRLALNSVPMAMNQSCYALKPKNGISFSFLFYLTKELIHHLEVKASGSVFNSIVSNDIEFTNLALPDDKTIIERFAEMAEPIFKRIEIATLENKQLSSQRDWLLPMLMNGQVTIKPS